MDIQVEDAHVLTPNKRVIFISAGPNEGVFISSEVSSDGKSVSITYDMLGGWIRAK